MPTEEVPAEHKAAVRDLVSFYKENLHLAELAAKSILALYESSKPLQVLTHSVKWRVKSVSSMEYKLARKAREAKATNAPFEITRDNFFDKITDCAGFRILHLNTNQFQSIDQILRSLLTQQSYDLFEPPFARVWDLEYRDYFNNLGIVIEDSRSYYTSVHYVIDFRNQMGCKCEIQVRTLAEELWGEVNHLINYPDDVQFLPCEEQIKALARSTSACTRLVDSIFATFAKRPRRKNMHA